MGFWWRLTHPSEASLIRAGHVPARYPHGGHVPMCPACRTEADRRAWDAEHPTHDMDMG